MQPVAHIVDYYEAQYRQADKTTPTDWQTLYRLRDQLQHYRTLNGTWNWTPRKGFTSQDQHEIPFDPPYRTKTRHNEDAYNKLLEAGAIDEDGKPID